MTIMRLETNLLGKVSWGIEGYEKFSVDETFVFRMKKTVFIEQKIKAT